MIIKFTVTLNPYFETSVNSLEVNENRFILTEITSFTNPVKKSIKNYFLIPSSIENNLIYLFITPSQTGLHQKHGFS